MIWVGQNSIAYLSVSNLCLFKERKKSHSSDLCSHSMTKLYAKIKGMRAVSLFDSLKTWQVCNKQYDITVIFRPATES